MSILRPQQIKNGILFVGIFLFVLGVFVIWRMIFVPTHIAEDPAFVAAPVMRVGVAHPLLANLIHEIGGSYVQVISMKEPGTSLEDTTDMCHEAVVFFGLNATADGWIKEVCGSGNDKTAVLFLDTYGGLNQGETSVASSSDSFSQNGGGYYWLTVQGGKNIARAIAKVLSEIDPVHKVTYLDAAYTVAYQLDDLYGSIKDKIYNLKSAPILVWGEGWQGIVQEYEGTIKQTIPVPQNDQERKTTIEHIAADLQKNPRTIIIGDTTLPFEEIKKLYRDGGRRMVILDPWGTFSDIWPYKVFVQQNLLRITQAL